MKHFQKCHLNCNYFYKAYYSAATPNQKVLAKEHFKEGSPKVENEVGMLRKENDQNFIELHLWNFSKKSLRLQLPLPPYETHITGNCSDCARQFTQEGTKTKYWEQCGYDE